jgi:hypothetical protein
VITTVVDQQVLRAKSGLRIRRERLMITERRDQQVLERCPERPRLAG